MPETKQEITPELLLHGYASGVFPMADAVDDPEIYWVDPHFRGVFPLDGFHVSRSLARRIKRAPYKVTVDQRFKEVVSACADRPKTWINREIFDLYIQLHHMGYAHSIEVMEDNTLVGGVYGIALRGAFFGESMFSRRTDTSKIALTYLVARLKFGGYRLFDTQFLTDHLKSLGACEIPREEYRQNLGIALGNDADFLKLPTGGQPLEILHLSNQTS
ncbi:MAG: leucyl/phenylalanyl-tRNA--protein transferase [Rhodobacterales bacterium]